ncbi:MAG: dihydroorotase, partial [Planctomycetota bacterium]|nr:dihydroorotase [Planctomycetota bacterium]
MQTILIKNGRVVDPSQKLDRVTNILLRDGKIAALDVAVPTDALVIDATDRIVVPGLIDLNTQLREPGFEEDETIRSGTAAALAGGYTTIACLASTEPPIDTQASVEFVQHQADRANHCRVVVIACVSQS